MAGAQNDVALRRAVAEAVRAARTARGLSQAKLATSIQSDIKTVGRIERGEFLPSLGTLVKIADLTGWSLDAIVGREVATLPTTPEQPAAVEPSPLAGLEDRVSRLERAVRVIAERGAEDREAVAEALEQSAVARPQKPAGGSRRSSAGRKAG